jgi:hypothetical protein
MNTRKISSCINNKLQSLIYYTYTPKSTTATVMLSSISLVNVKFQRNETKSLKLHNLEITEELVTM